MNIKIAIKYLVQTLAFTLLVQAVPSLASDDQSAKTAAIIAKLAKKIGVGNVTMDWSGNSEVKEIAVYEPDKRIASLSNTIAYLTKNEEKIFPDVRTNNDQLAANVITRIFSLTHLSALVGSTDNDVIIKDFLDGEIADLKLVLSGKISYGQYLSSHEMRDNKRLILLFQDQKVVTEMVTQGRKEGNIAQTLANKTTMISFVEACMANHDLCPKL